MFFNFEELAEGLKSYLKDSGIRNQSGVNYLSLKKAAEVYGKSRNFFYNLRSQGKIKLYKFESGNRSASFIKIDELEEVLRPE